MGCPVQIFPHVYVFSSYLSIEEKLFFGLEFDVGESVFSTCDVLHAVQPNRRCLLAISE